MTDHRIVVGLEEGPDGSVLAHGLTVPGCAAWGADAPSAVAAFQGTLLRWLRFRAAHGEPVPPPDAELELVVDEWLRTEADVAAGHSTACFADDLRALGDAELQAGLRQLGDLRGALLTQVKRVREAGLDVDTGGGTTARRVLEELARAQWWTLSRLGATPLAGPPDRTMARLDAAMALVVQHLGHLDPARRADRLELDGEEWTPRKVLRRLLWLEWTLGGTAARALASTEDAA